MKTKSFAFLPPLALTLLLGARAGPAIAKESPPEKPLAEVQTRAESGELAAVHDLCYRYKYGRGVQQDFAEALRWCRLAAERGADSSQVLLAEMYFNGEGVDKDPKQALRWYLAAADQEHPHALLMLYFIYTEGVGVEPNRERGLTFLRAAAALDYGIAVKELARISAGN